jgi:hypothetical protein
MRAELTQKNLGKYVHFYNFERPHSALMGYTPACAWLAGSKERFGLFMKNTNHENREQVFADIETMVKVNYVKATVL